MQAQDETKTKTINISYHRIIIVGWATRVSATKREELSKIQKKQFGKENISTFYLRLIIANIKNVFILVNKVFNLNFIASINDMTKE